MIHVKLTTKRVFYSAVDCMSTSQSIKQDVCLICTIIRMETNLEMCVPCFVPDRCPLTRIQRGKVTLEFASSTNCPVAQWKSALVGIRTESYLRLEGRVGEERNMNSDRMRNKEYHNEIERERERGTWRERVPPPFSLSLSLQATCHKTSWS